MDTFSYELRIPKLRIPVLIGVKGVTKRKIERETDCVLDVDSKEGVVTVTGSDGLNLLTAQEIVKAIARGFNPRLAMQLVKPDWSFELIDLNMLARNKKDMERIKGRIIGSKGKSRSTVESLTETHISVFGKTIAIIGQVENVAMCKRALAMLIQGSPHASVYQFLERERRKWKMPV